jgi:hypothetical protein
VPQPIYASDPVYVAPARVRTVAAALIGAAIGGGAASLFEAFKKQ